AVLCKGFVHVPDISAHALQGSLLDRFYAPLPCRSPVFFIARYGRKIIPVSIYPNPKFRIFDRTQYVAVGDSQEQLNFSRKPNFAMAMLFKLGSNPVQLLCGDGYVLYFGPSDTG